MTRNEFFTALANGAKWNVGVSIARTNPLPLDANSVFESLEALDSYVKSNPLAYPGQLVSVIGETELSAYHVTSVGESGTYSKLAASSASGDVAGDIATLQGQVATLISDLDALEAIVGTDAASGLQKTVADNTAAIEAVEGRLDTLEGDEATEGSVKKQIKDAVDAIDFSEDFDAKGSAAAVKDELDAYKTSNDAAVQQAQADIDAVEAKLGEIPADKNIITLIEESKYDDSEVKASIKSNTDAITLLSEGVDPEKIDSVKDLIDYVDTHGTEVTGIKENVAANTAAIAAEVTRATGIESGLDTRIAALEAYDHAADVQAAKDYADEQITALGIADYAKKADVTTDIATAKSEAIADAEGKIATAKQEVIEAAATDAASKANAVRGETEATVASVETAVDNLSTRINDIVATGGEPNTINSIKVNGQEQAIVDKVVDVAVPTKLDDLTGYTELASLVAGKVDAVDGASLVDDDDIAKLQNLATINSVSTELTINDSNELAIVAVDVSKVTGLNDRINSLRPAIASETIPGLVLSTTVENGISVDTTGAMTVNSLNVNKLTQTEGERLILNGGSATV